MTDQQQGTSSPAPFAGPTEGGDPRVADVRRRLNAAHAASAAPPAKAAAKLAAQHKLYVRERIDLLFDEGSFVEDGRYANAMAAGLPGRRCGHRARHRRRPAGDRRRQRPDREGRLVGRPHGREDRAGHRRWRCARSCRSSGSSTPPARGSPTRSSSSRDAAAPGGSSTTRWRCRARCRRSAACSGPSAAGGAYIPAFTDIVIMVEGNASMYLGSPRMAEMVVGETVSLEEMGGARMHCTVSGCGDLLATDDADAIELARLYFSYLPSSWRTESPSYVPEEPSAPLTRSTVPEVESQPFDIHEVIDGLRRRRLLLRDQAAVRRRAGHRLRPDGRRDRRHRGQQLRGQGGRALRRQRRQGRPVHLAAATPSRSRWSTWPTCRGS